MDILKKKNKHIQEVQKLSKSYSEITPYIKELAGLSCGNNHITPEMYPAHNVKRGLRDRDGNGVVTGLTEISHIKAKEKPYRFSSLILKISKVF